VNLSGPRAWIFPDGRMQVLVRCRDCGWVASRTCTEGEIEKTLATASRLAEAHPCTVPKKEGGIAP
jgi:DNA polymerase II large subunit